MAKRIFILFFVVLNFNSFSQNITSKTDTRSFQGGELLEYSLSYSFISAGTATLSVKDTLLDGHQLYHLEILGRTTGLTDVIYKVRDIYQSFIFPDTDMPYKAIRDISEGGYRYYNEVIFNRDSSTVISKRSGIKKVPDNILDILSAFYYARNHYFGKNMKKGNVISFETYFSDKLYPFKMIYLGLETINTKFGKIECYKYAPVTEVGRVFKSNDDMFLWITRDKNKIPVKIKFNLIVGSFVCNLESFQGLKYPFSSILIKSKK